ncbi:MAG TPA: hypothetical protein PKE06_16420 [Flavilitoribacter sp.]|nr:hypothetical protein [Flavilitoribacter sp.]HMQ87121.1 hypothetical protein [Flavilitoribacter sp.]
MPFKRLKKFLSSINPTAATAFAAVFTSFCALGISIYQSVILRNEQYAAVWPYIEPTVTYTNHSFALNIQNKGTGPAIIKNVSIFLNGEPVNDYRAFLVDLLHQDQFQSLSISSLKNSVLAIQENVTMLQAEFPDSVVIVTTDFQERSSIKICYCSIFGDCWQYTDGDVKKIRQCGD